MEQAKINTFNCPIHPKFVINIICSNSECANPLCCVGCTLDDNFSHLAHKKHLVSIDDYIDYAAKEYKKVERLKLGQEGPPQEFTDYILGEDERLQNLSKHIEEEKKNIEQILNNMMDEFKEICTKAKTAAFHNLDQQFNNFRMNHDLYKGKLKKFYGDNNAPNPTKSELVKKLNEVRDLHEYMKVFNEIQSDFIDRAPTDPNLLEKKIEEVKNKVKRLGQTIKIQQESRPKLQFTTQKAGHIDLLEDFSKRVTQMLEDAFKLVSPIPRVIDISLFETIIMNANEEAMLDNWVNPKQQFKYKLLYRASRDGFTADAFHTKVGSLKPTVVIIKSEFDKRFGGYSDIDWNGAGNYKQSNNTFLFSFDEKEVYPVKSAQHAILCHPNYGPIFGAGHDICIYNQSNTSNSNSSNFNNSYDSKGKSCNHLTGGQNFKTKEIEVFQLL